MSKIYLHYSDKSLVMDSSENLLYPLIGSLLKWDNLRIGICYSVTQSTSDDNAPLISNEMLPISNGLPLLNRMSIGLKSKNTAIVGESDCNFLGITNASTSNGSSVGFYEGSPLISSSQNYKYQATLGWTGAAYLISGAPIYAPLTSPFNNSGTTFVAKEGSGVNFNGIEVSLQAPLSNGNSGIFLTSSVPVSLGSGYLQGKIEGDSIRPEITLSANQGSYQTSYTFNSYPQTLTLPSASSMQGSVGYMNVLILDYKVLNRGNLATQSVKIGMQVVTSQSNSNPKYIESLVASYSPTIETPYIAFPQNMPTSIFIRWPFWKTRLRVHSILAKKV